MGRVAACACLAVALGLLGCGPGTKAPERPGGPATVGSPATSDRSQPVKLQVGFPEEFDPGEVGQRFRGYDIWVVRAGGRFFALDRVCPHCNSPPRRVDWLLLEMRFKCPGCGSGFRITGIPFEGPARRALCRFAIRLGAGGRLEVDSGRRFRQDLGQCEHPDSFVKDAGQP
jgi:nitrite reductase/ring-hydroxylating ferredoxin subunit